MLNSFVAGVKKFIVSEDGPTAVEYAVMLALIVIVCLSSIQLIGQKANTAFDTIQGTL
jgi:pilus assembly protein Flp/PilA